MSGMELGMNETIDSDGIWYMGTGLRTMIIPGMSHLKVYLYEECW